MKVIRDGLSKVSIVYVLIGLVLLVAPMTSLKLVGWGIGGAIIVFGVTQIIGALKRGGVGGIIWGTVCCLIGGGIWSRFPSMVSFLPFVIGIIVFFSGLTKLQGALEERRNGFRWLPLMIGAVISMGLGLLVMFNPFSTLALSLRIIGLVLLLDGAENLLEAWAVHRRMKSQGYLAHEGEDGIIDVIVDEE